MAKAHGKQYTAALQKIDRARFYTPEEAVALIKETSFTKFDATVEVRCVPIGQWHDQIFTDFAAKGGADVVILDSQFIGEAVVGNHVVELTDWMKENIEVSDFVPEALSAGKAPEALCIIAMKPVTPKFALTPSTVK